MKLYMEHDLCKETHDYLSRLPLPKNDASDARPAPRVGWRQAVKDALYLARAEKLRILYGAKVREEASGSQGS